VTTTGWTHEVQSLYADRGIGGRLTPTGEPALVIVDLINGFTDPGCAPGFDLDEVVDNTGTLIDGARAAGRLVVFTTIAFSPEELHTLVWLRKMPALKDLVAGSRWVEVDPRLRAREDEPVVVKRAASAFCGTGLADLLDRAGVSTLVLAGATTSGCIRATAIDACSLGWTTFVPAACVGDRVEGPHTANLLDIDAKYADVVTTAIALDILAGRKDAS
jgi:nicotinamidase-related amidase